MAGLRLMSLSEFFAFVERFNQEANPDAPCDGQFATQEPTEGNVCDADGCDRPEKCCDDPHGPMFQNRLRRLALFRNQYHAIFTMMNWWVQRMGCMQAPIVDFTINLKSYMLEQFNENDVVEMPFDAVELAHLHTLCQDFLAFGNLCGIGHSVISEIKDRLQESISA